MAAKTEPTEGANKQVDLESKVCSLYKVHPMLRVVQKEQTAMLDVYEGSSQGIIKDSSEVSIVTTDFPDLLL